MSDFIPPGARTSPSAARNRDPIALVLRPRLPASGLVLEIASGTGEHAVCNARALPHLDWQPTETDPDAFPSISAWRDHAGLPNLWAPMLLDASRPDTWPVTQADVILAINMIHISPWATTEGLLAGAGRILPAGGLLVLYGPFIEAGVETAPSNLAFDHDLKSRNPAWELRDLQEVTALARQFRLNLAERVTMPANNLTVFFRKTS